MTKIECHLDMILVWNIKNYQLKNKIKLYIIHMNFHFYNFFFSKMLISIILKKSYLMLLPICCDMLQSDIYET